ncbi:TauD/TfdA family dioxygenase [Streptomyces sp. NPDC001852]|uniref:TauD/TfdA family dioxygenase n=1 Tax=Streptomyces sp. NPDC001852 TaxID=3364619 RepID=UPI0036815C51
MLRYGGIRVHGTSHDCAPVRPAGVHARQGQGSGSAGVLASPSAGESGVPARPHRATAGAAHSGARSARGGGPDGTRAAADRELHDFIDTTAASPAVRLELDLQPGDLQVLDNHMVLHARSRYEDFDTQGSRPTRCRPPPAPAHGRSGLRRPSPRAH